MSLRARVSATPRAGSRLGRLVRFGGAVWLTCSLLGAGAAAGAVPNAPQRTANGPVLDAADANDLAQTLADVASTQHVCYGWVVNVTDNSGGQSGVDAGSSKDPSTADPAQQCKKFVILHADVYYSCDSCETNDSASYSIVSNLPSPPSPHDLDKLGVGPAAMLADNNDTGLINSVEALPLVVAEKGEARAVSPDLTPKPASSPDHPTGSVSDSSKTEEAVGGGVLLAIGLVWGLLELRGARRRRGGPATPAPAA